MLHVEGKRNLVREISRPENLHYRYISGHIRLPIFLRLIDLREWFLFTCIRRPINHIISHLNWVKFVGSPENSEFRRTHQPDIQSLAIELFKVDLDDVERLTKIIFHSHPIALQLFDNCQTRYFIPEKKGRLDSLDVQQAMNFMRCVDMIIKSENINEGLDRLHIAAKLSPKVDLIGKSNFGKNRQRPNLENESVRKFYHSLAGFDAQIYNSL